MEAVSNDGMCRCCASEGSFKDFQVPYQWMGVEEIYGNMLKDCFDITLSVSEEINNGGICEVCITQLRNACNFKQQVQKTEEMFKKKMQDGALKTDTIKMEISRFEDDDSNMSAEDFSSQEYEVPIKVEKVEEKPKKRASARASTSKAKKAKASEGEPSVKRSRRHKTIEIRIGETPKTSKRVRAKRKEPELIMFKKGGELQKHRFNLRQILFNTNATPIRCRGGIGYACCFCVEQFPDPADLKKHTIEFHDDKAKLNFMKGKDMYKFLVKLDITALKCNICGTHINTLEQVIDHLRDVHNKEMFTDVKHQVLPFKFDTETLQCCVCKNAFHKFKSLLEHMNIHYRNHICEVCDAGFVSRVILAQHAESHKLGIFNCDYCAKTFDTFRKKRSHEKCIHTHSASLNKCGYCNEKFKDYRKKERHLKEAHGVSGTLKCQACDKTFNNQKEYSVHLRRLHLMDRRYRCTECDMSFFSSAELKCHMVKHTGVRNFECELCHKTYGRMKTLREHMRIHMDDRRFKCEHCGQAFVQKCSWRGHMRSKHGEQV